MYACLDKTSILFMIKTVVKIASSFTNVHIHIILLISWPTSTRAYIFAEINIRFIRIFIFM